MTGQRPEFARVYEDQAWRVYGFIAYRVRDPLLAEDLTQATFERALRAWPRFDSRRASEATWLAAIARNLIIDHYRKRQVVVEEKLPTRQDDWSYAGPETLFLGSPELASALGELSQREQEVIGLRFGADLAGAEIAEMLELSVANVQQILSRTLKRLRERLEGSEIESASPGRRVEAVDP